MKGCHRPAVNGVQQTKIAAHIGNRVPSFATLLLNISP
jgi:hypothetical protein